MLVTTHSDYQRTSCLFANLHYVQENFNLRLTQTKKNYATMEDFFRVDGHVKSRSPNIKGNRWIMLEWQAIYWLLISSFWPRSCNLHHFGHKNIGGSLSRRVLFSFIAAFVASSPLLVDGQSFEKASAHLFAFFK